jgi:cation diffusion facilitator CzcD-associated flavoprotein CzcO
MVDVAIIGAGITGLYTANRLMEAGIPFCIFEKSGLVGGIWSTYANRTSRVNSSECAYRLLEKKTRSNRDHSDTNEILEDIAQLAQNVAGHLFIETEVEGIEADGNHYHIRLNRKGDAFFLESKGVILAINDRVGTPREVKWEGQAAFQGTIVSGISNRTEGLDWRNKKVVIIGMGAFAVENARTALEGGARHVTVVCRRHGTICPKIIDYLNFTTPYDDAFKHDKKSNLLNMMYWKKMYELSGVPAAASKCIKTAVIKLHRFFNMAAGTSGGDGVYPRRFLAGAFHGGRLSFMRKLLPSMMRVSA